MERKDQIEVVQKHMDGLRAEIGVNVSSQAGIIKVLILGIAGIFALSDVSLAQVSDLAPILPLVGLAVAAFLLGHNVFLLRLARWIARDERKTTPSPKRISFVTKLLFGVRGKGDSLSCWAVSPR